MIGKVLTAKAASLATTAMLSLGGVAAASTGSLPAPVQGAVSEAAGQVGIEIPKTAVVSVETSTSSNSLFELQPAEIEVPTTATTTVKADDSVKAEEAKSGTEAEKSAESTKAESKLEDGVAKTEDKTPGEYESASKDSGTDVADEKSSKDKTWKEKWAKEKAAKEKAAKEKAAKEKAKKEKAKSTTTIATEWKEGSDGGYEKVKKKKK